MMALTRNEACVHEKHGRFSRAGVPGRHGPGGRRDRPAAVHCAHWALRLRAGAKRRAAGPRRSLQFFDRRRTRDPQGLRRPPRPTPAAFAGSPPRRRRAAGGAGAVRSRRPAPPAERPDAEIDVAGLPPPGRRSRTPTNSSGCCGASGSARAQAMRLAGPDLARPVRGCRDARGADAASRPKRLPIMVFVGNPGLRADPFRPGAPHRGHGPLAQRARPALQPAPARGPHRHGAWVVRKPSVNGDIHSLELSTRRASSSCRSSASGRRGERRAHGLARARRRPAGGRRMMTRRGMARRRRCRRRRPRRGRRAPRRRGARAGARRRSRRDRLRARRRRPGDRHRRHRALAAGGGGAAEGRLPAAALGRGHPLADARPGARRAPMPGRRR